MVSLRSGLLSCLDGSLPARLAVLSLRRLLALPAVLGTVVPLRDAAKRRARVSSACTTVCAVVVVTCRWWAWCPHVPGGTRMGGTGAAGHVSRARG